VPVDAPLYPVGLVVAGRPVLVVGGGRVAARKVADLVVCGARVTVVAPEVVPEVAERDDLVVERRPYRSGEAARYRLVVTATGDPVVDQQVFDDAEAAGVWVNSADDPARCTFTLPAVVRRGPVVVTAATGGHSPALATWLRRQLAGRLGPEVAVLAALLDEARTRVRAAGRSTEDLDWQGLLDGGLLDVLVADGEDAARARIDAWLQRS
jgi:precorrin-2 dehydrogenase / sirohydrochlorin ferrochelatase